MTKEKETKEVKTEVKEAKLVEVPASFAEAIELEDGTLLNDRQLLVRIYNDLQKINKKL